MHFQYASDIFGTYPLVTCLLAFVFGNLIGSFLNVLALRSLKEESIIWPTSYCPSCKHSLAPLDNVPVLSYFMLGAKCRYCKAPISWQYPFVEFTTGLVFAAIAFQFLVLQINVPQNYSTALYNSDPFTTGNQAPSFFGWVAAVLDNKAPDLLKFIQDGHGMAASQVMPLPEFQKYGLALGCFVFASVLITVCVTDFREKLIPHEITYPAMIFGIIFSTMVRGDFFGTMTGIGASYIIFDFMAFYGLKLYLATHPELLEEAAAEQSLHQGADPNSSSAASAASTDPLVETSAKQIMLSNNESAISEQSHQFDPQASAETEAVKSPASGNSENLNPSATSSLPKTSENSTEQEPEQIEVMGGGDAVLSAVMSAYLGWKLLFVALIIGFLSGTVMGIGLLFVEMKKSGLLKDCFKTAGLWALGFFALFGGLTLAIYSIVSQGDFAAALKPAISTGFLGLIGGALLGTVIVGSKVSKPFPFGPALALGGFVAMFLIPNWCPFY